MNLAPKRHGSRDRHGVRKPNKAHIALPSFVPLLGYPKDLMHTGAFADYSRECPQRARPPKCPSAEPSPTRSAIQYSLRCALDGRVLMAAASLPFRLRVSLRP